MHPKTLVLLLLVCLASARKYPQYKQCDSLWQYTLIGFSSDKTICDVGGHITSVAMALDAVDKKFTPATINSWLQERNGFKKDMILWDAVNPLGLQYAGTLPNNYIFQALNSGSVVIINVMGGEHWALATSMVGATIYVNEPLYENHSYNIQEIVPNQSILYAVINNRLGVNIEELQLLFNVNNRRDKMLKMLTKQ